MVGRARRALSCFLMTLSWSRALYLEFFFDQTTENFLRGHVHAFEAWNGQPRVLLYDNLKSAVLERRGGHVRFNPRLVELGAHYHFAPRACQVRAGNQSSQTVPGQRFRSEARVLFARFVKCRLRSRARCWSRLRPTLSGCVWRY
jgi:transposase